MKSDYDIAREIMESDREAIIDNMDILLAMGEAYNKGDGLFIKGRQCETVLKGSKGIDINEEGRDFAYQYNSRLIYIESKSSKHVLLKKDFKDPKQRLYRKHKSTNTLVLPKSIIIFNANNADGKSSKLEVSQELVDEVCSRSAMLAILDSGDINSCTVNTVDFKVLKQIPLAHWSGGSSLKVDIPIDIVDPMFCNSEIRPILENLTDKKLEKAKCKVAKNILIENLNRLELDMEQFLDYNKITHGQKSRSRKGFYGFFTKAKGAIKW